MDVKKLKAEMVLKDLSIPKLAAKMGIGKKALYQKMKGVTQFTLPEIRTICNLLDISGEKILDIFFNEKVA